MCGEAFRVNSTTLSYKSIKAEATTDKFEVAENESINRYVSFNKKGNYF